MSRNGRFWGVMGRRVWKPRTPRHGRCLLPDKSTANIAQPLYICFGNNCWMRFKCCRSSQNKCDMNNLPAALESPRRFRWKRRMQCPLGTANRSYDEMPQISALSPKWTSRTGKSATSLASSHLSAGNKSAVFYFEDGSLLLLQNCHTHLQTTKL